MKAKKSKKRDELLVSIGMIREYGVLAAVLYAYILTQLREATAESVVLTTAELEAKLGVNEYHQRHGLRTLTANGLIALTRKGLPPKRTVRVLNPEHEIGRDANEKHDNLLTLDPLMVL